MTWHVNPVPNIDDTWHIVDEFDTKEAAIAHGVQEYKNHLEGTWTELFDNDYNYPDPPTSLFEVGERLDFVPHVDVDMILDDVVEQASWQCGEAGDDWLRWGDVTKKQQAELQENMQKVFDEWLKKYNNEPTFYNIIHIEEIDAKDYV